MIRTLDRYVLREIVVPMAIALAILTFLLEVPTIMDYGERLVARGAPWSVIFQVLILLLPASLSITIPMSVLIGILVGFGRLSADREFIAMQACGVSLLRLARPVALIAVVATAATAHQTIVALPAANQQFREVVFSFISEQIENTVRPRVFFNEFTHRVIYVRDVPADGSWRDVFFADSDEGRVTVYFAREGRIALDREQRLVQLQLIDGISHAASISNADELQSSTFGRMDVTLDPNTVFPPPPPKGAPEMTFAELNQRIAEEAAAGNPAYLYRFMYQQKLSLPATCPILALIALALGASSRRDGRLASVALGIGVLFVYYVLLWAARAAAEAGQINADLAPWVPNILMGIAAIVLMLWRSRSADQPIRLSLPAFWRRSSAAAEPSAEKSADSGKPLPRGRRVVVVVKLPHLNVPKPRTLDVYIARDYVRVFILGLVGLMGVFYIATFIDLADELLGGEATTGMLVQYFFYQTPQFFYYVMPMAVLVATLVTVGVLTKNSELIVMRACGISLYRTMLPLLAFSLLGSAVLFGVGERMLAPANREADRLVRVIRGLPPRTSTLNRNWIAGTGGQIYRFDFYDADNSRLQRLWVYQLDEEAWSLRAMTFAESATPASLSTEDGQARWKTERGWIREFPTGRPGEARPSAQAIRYEPFQEHFLELDGPEYFTSDAPTADMMTYGQLSDYIEQLQSSGAYAARYMVALQRKVAFPFVTLIMTMLAVPFAVTTGRRGALYGIGIGIVLAIAYIIALSLFAALGDGGMLSPTLAAWAPNVLFGAAAAYMVLTVRT